MSVSIRPAPPSDLWQYFVDVGIWPKRARLDPVGWLKNFSTQESPLALRLLQGFTYFSSEFVQQMFRATFLNVSQLVVTQKGNYLSAKSEWSRFMATARIVRVTGEKPSDADSGYLFARYARDLLNFPEAQVVSPEKALADLIQRPDGSVIFVDDFVGSGNQFVQTWTRSYTIGTTNMSFAAIASAMRGRIKFFYCPVICTALGSETIRKACPEVHITPAHLIDSRHSTLSDTSVIWREDMKSEGPAFVRHASSRAGIPYLRGEVGCCNGFHELGLALAFEHGWPDATIPLFYWNQNGWKPLLKKGAV